MTSLSVMSTNQHFASTFRCTYLNSREVVASTPSFPALPPECQCQWLLTDCCQWLNISKNMPETVLRKKKIHILWRKRGTYQTKPQKRSKDDFIQESWWPVRESGRSVPSQESWHVCYWGKDNRSLYWGLHYIEVWLYKKTRKTRKEIQSNLH